jgi:hypothetical protein
MLMLFRVLEAGQTAVPRVASVSVHSLVQVRDIIEQAALVKS